MSELLWERAWMNRAELQKKYPSALSDAQADALLYGTGAVHLSWRGEVRHVPVSELFGWVRMWRRHEYVTAIKRNYRRNLRRRRKSGHA